MICQTCSKELSDNSRFCTRCGRPVTPLRRSTAQPKTDDMNLPLLYTMVAGLLIALLFPPWETAPGQPPEFLGFHFILNPPANDGGTQQDAGVISRLLLTIELVTIAVAGMYFAWLFRRK
ncbi:MAG TPA: zinc ribbon domain-containing protein [Nitrospiraceae bacterium]|nr:zinc ribbon domain-containing protein [Nitrospiraceae bacterium]